MNENILAAIAEKTKERIREERRKIPLFEMRNNAEAVAAFGTGRQNRPTFYQALAYLQIAGEYEAAGAAAISCLTEPYYFQGSDRYLKQIASTAAIPVLKKDFTVDEYMVYQAAAAGAAAILLICAILDDAQLKSYMELAVSLRLDVLTEAHTEEEIERAVRAGASIIGVNNRDLKTFRVDLNTSIAMRSLVPPEILFVSESGIRTAADIEKLYANGTNAVLIGEALMRSPDKKAMLDELRGTFR